MNLVKVIEIEIENYLNQMELEWLYFLKVREFLKVIIIWEIYKGHV